MRRAIRMKRAIVDDPDSVFRGMMDEERLEELGALPRTYELDPGHMPLLERETRKPHLGNVHDG